LPYTERCVRFLSKENPLPWTSDDAQHHIHKTTTADGGFEEAFFEFLFPDLRVMAF
jgi:hypothetical protein